MEKDSWKTLRYEASSEHESFCRHTEACNHQLLLSYVHTQLKMIIQFFFLQNLNLKKLQWGLDFDNNFSSQIC